MKAGESYFKGQILELDLRTGHGLSQTEAQESDRRLATHEGWVRTPWNPTGELCLSWGAAQKLGGRDKEDIQES